MTAVQMVITTHCKSRWLLKPNGVIGHFTLPKADWWTDYYIPIQARLSAMRKTYQANPEALEVIEEETKEIHLFIRYSDWYGYVFTVATLR
ncbi:MAG: hypothetical protein WCL39_09490 [Armatimonadota bacterium]